MTRLRCRLFGHVPNEAAWRHGRLECERCGEDGCGWDRPDWDGAVGAIRRFVLLRRHRAWRWRRWVFDRCVDCGRTSTLLGREVGDHRDCIPF